MKIALDALGGDDAPRITIAGALIALKEESGGDERQLEVSLVGDRKAMRPYLPERLPQGLKIFDIPPVKGGSDTEFVSEGDNPKSAIRTAAKLHAEGHFDAVVSAGSTGAQVLASLLEFEKCAGITRPAVGSIIPTANGQAYLLDVGASLVATPHHLVQFAAMGHVYVREILGIPEPRIGLVNVAGEAGSGDRVAVEAFKLLDGSGFNFVGFVEGRDIPAGAADVIVTNGLVGNVLLKFAEGLPALLQRILPPSADGTVLAAIKQHFDYNASGGEPLLGVKGVSIICHGASNENAIAAAVVKAARIARLRLHERIEEFLTDKFTTYYSQVKYLRSFRRSLHFHTGVTKS